MAAFEFPANPTLGQVYTPIAGVSYKFNGTGWLPFTQNAVSLTQAQQIQVGYVGTPNLNVLEVAIGTSQGAPVSGQIVEIAMAAANTQALDKIKFGTGAEVDFYRFARNTNDAGIGQYLIAADQLQANQVVQVQWSVTYATIIDYWAVGSWLGARKTISTVAPVSGDGIDGDVWFQY